MNEKTVRMITEAEEEMRNAERTVKDQILDLEREIEVADRRNAALNTRLTDALDRAMRAERDASVYTARAERAEAALAECRRVIAAIPWRALASIYAHPGVVLDADAWAVGEFLDQHADAWAGGFELRLIEEKQLERQAGDYARSLIAASAPSDFRRARGVIPWQPGDEPAETTIRRLRDAPERAERAEAALAAVPWQALLNISHTLDASDAASDFDEAALLAFLNRYAPWVPKESEG